MTSPASPGVVCPACSTPGSGRFCANCGASLEGAGCAGCAVALTPGARFCHRCGMPAAGGHSPMASPAAPAARTTFGTSLPWIVAAVAVVSLLAFLAGNAFNARRGSTLDAPQNALPQAGLDDRGAGMGGLGSVRAPDISRLSPEERADRLFNRVMLLNSQGKSDSVQFFAPMAINAYQMIGPLSADHRYDIGRIAEVAGALPMAKAQADTILRENPSHLLGLILGAQIAALSNDIEAQRSYETRLLRVYSTESAKRLPEYQRHSDDIENALVKARQSVGAPR